MKVLAARRFFVAVNVRSSKSCFEQLADHRAHVFKIERNVSNMSSKSSIRTKLIFILVVFSTFFFVSHRYQCHFRSQKKVNSFYFKASFVSLLFLNLACAVCLFHWVRVCGLALKCYPCYIINCMGRTVLQKLIFSRGIRCLGLTSCCGLCG